MSGPEDDCPFGLAIPDASRQHVATILDHTAARWACALVQPTTVGNEAHDVEGLLTRLGEHTSHAATTAKHGELSMTAPANPRRWN